MYRTSLIFMILAAVSAGKHDHYAGYSVFGLKLRDRSDQVLVQELEQNYDVDIWQYGYPDERDAMIMVSPENKRAVLGELDDKDLTYYLHMDDVVKALETHKQEVTQWRESKTRSGRLVPFEEYPRYEEVDAYLERVAAQHPEIVTLVNAGQSFEGRDIKYLKISTTNFTDTSKPIYFMDAMLHAREWVTLPVPLFSIHRLVENLRDQDRDLLEDIDWIILPLANPDGYEYSHDTFRMWRKTRSYRPEVSATCWGVDANRNFDMNWNTTGVSQNPCVDTYPGTAAFSEPETSIVRDILLEHVDRIQVYMDIHSHGNWLLFPYGDYTLPPNAVHLFHVASAMGNAMDALKLPAAGFYRIGNSAMILYGASGAADDYGQIVGVPLSFTLELPGYGYQFLVPPRFIEHINYETWEGIAVSARLARTYYRARIETYSVFGLKLRDYSDQVLVQDLELNYNVDIWQYGYPEERDALIMVSPENKKAVLGELDISGLTYYLHMGDVVKALETHEQEVKQWKDTRTRGGRLVPFEDYPRYAEIDAYLEGVAAQYPEIVTLVNAGQSFEGRDIKYLKISTTNFTDTSKPIYLMNAMLHAREWVTTPVTLFSIHRLVENLRDQDRDLLKDIDWIILPLVNPDGYEYSHTTFRMWRRTRSFNAAVSTTCWGVDGNRNFDVNWNTTGVSQDPCWDTYPGAAPFSEPETGIVRDILLEHVDRIQTYMDIHSHGNWLLFAFGNRTLPSNAVQIFHVASEMGAVMDALKLPAAVFYRIGNSAMILYGSSGSAQDYGQEVGVPFSYTLELPGYGYQFLVPPHFIEHINYETWEGIAASARLSREYYRARLAT